MLLICLVLSVKREDSVQKNEGGIGMALGDATLSFGSFRPPAFLILSEVSCRSAWV